MHTRAMASHEGEFEDDVRIDSRPCPKCKQTGSVTYRIWESNCGGYEDAKYSCSNCKHYWWVDGVRFLTRPTVAGPVTALFKLQHGAYVLNVPCPRCRATDGWTCFPGQWPRCWRCGSVNLMYGRTPEADCVSPNGRIDGHGMYVSGTGKAGENVCAFCKRAI